MSEPLQPNDPNPSTFLQIPSDLKICVFQYLDEMDLYSLEKTCRSVRIDAINPNSLTELWILDVAKLNKYTQNIRYSRIKRLDIDFDSRNWIPKELSILPIAYSFTELQRLTTDLKSFQAEHTKQFNDFLGLFYDVLANGNSNKIVDFQGNFFNMRCPANSLRSAIFDSKYNSCAKKAVNNIKSLIFEGWTNKRDILQNIFDSMNAEHSLDLIEIRFDVYDEWDEFNENWKWEFYRQIVKQCKLSKLHLTLYMLELNEAPWICKEWIDIMRDDKFFTEFTLVLEQNTLRYDPEDPIDEFQIIKEHMKRWLIVDETLMKKTGMKYFEGTHRYSILDDETNEEMFEETREYWDREYIELKPQLDQYSMENDFFNYYVYSQVLDNDLRIWLDVSYKKRLKI